MRATPNTKDEPIEIPTEDFVSLARLLESQFRGDIRFRGAAYLEAERVEIVRATPEDLHGIVRDGTEFETHLSRQNDTLNMYCSCASESTSRNISCKHLWATVLAVDAGDYLSAPPREGKIPPFVADDTFASLMDFSLDDAEEDLLSGEIYQPKSTTTRAPKAAPRKLKEWEQQLVELRQQINGSEEGAKAQERDREIFFEIDAVESRECGLLVVQTSQRQRRANGQWGKLKPLKLRPGRLGEIEHDDVRRILAYLTGGTPERSSWIAQQAEFQSAVFRYRIPHELCELLLPRMCATGHTRMLNAAEKGSSSLMWDEGEPWELALVLDTGGTGSGDDSSDKWKLDGELRRGDERIPLDRLDLLVPGGLAVYKNRILSVEDFGAQPWVKMLTSNQRLTGAAEDAVELVDQLLDLPNLPTLDLPEELRLEEVRVAPKPLLTVTTPQTRGFRQERLSGRVQFEYDGTKVPASSRQWAIVQREAGRCLLRDRAFEEQAWHLLQELGFRRRLDQRRTDQDVDIAVTELGNAVRTLADGGWHILADGHEVRQPGTPNLKIRSGIDWFELSGEVDFDGQTIDFPELLAALARKDNTIRLPDGSLGILPDNWAEQYGLISGLGTMQEGSLRFSVTQAGLIDALLAAKHPVDVDEEFQVLRDRLTSFEGVAPAMETDNFTGELRPYQREGLGWLEFLRDFNFGGCLADDMGLGKTVQVLALLLEHVATRKANKPSLIVVPKSLLFNWAHEIQRFTPQLSTMEYSGTSRAELREEFAKHDVILTTYGTLRRDIADLKDTNFDFVVLDEAQTIKNASSQVAKASRLLQADHRLALSGTPIENHLGDLWSIFEFLNPGMLGRSSVFKLYSNDATDTEAQSALSQGLRPFVLRRTKKEVATELPDKFEETIYCDMDDAQRRRYDELREHYRQSLLGMVKEQGLGKSKMHVLEALLRLRQAACHPGLLSDDALGDPSAKLDVLTPHLEELIDEGHKSLVFSQFTSMLSIVRQKLDEKGINYAYLDGKTRNREQVVESFQNDPNTHIFLISLKAGGLGLNLTAAEYVFLLDPWWNPAVEAQAIDRAHRVGQTKQVFAYRLIC
ncbi:MAG: DEAD/DEAH box helicase family protein, partial [Planctomycetaceae bacterium]|nr:DEAD/DEAH box helicase family protein [Planctomycetaceae bacterium]